MSRKLAVVVEGSPKVPSKKKREVPPEAKGRLLEPVAPSIGQKPAIEVHAYRIGGADVLLPGSFKVWAAEVKRSCAFRDQPDEVARLQRTVPSEVIPDGRPVVGIMVSEPAHLLLDTDEGSLVELVIETIEAHGCRAVVVPPLADLAVASKDRAGVPAALVAELDGLIGLGGHDVHPRIYGEHVRYARHTNYPRDRFEADVALAAMKADLFMLGICRSHQLWNAATGGEMVQDIVKEGYSSIHRHQEGHGVPMRKAFVLHDDDGNVVFSAPVEIEAGSRLRGVVGKASMLTNASHHQAVKKPGEPFHVVGTSVDPIIGVRMIQATESPKAFTVQFHPEQREKSPPDEALIAALCRRAHVFRLAKEIRSEGGDPTAAELAARMRASEVPFELSDYEWVKADLEAQLRAGAAQRPKRAKVHGRSGAEAS